MGKTILVITVILAIGLLFATFGCTVAQSSTNNGIFGTEKTTTTVGTSGVQTTTKTCPFWNPNC